MPATLLRKERSLILGAKLVNHALPQKRFDLLAILHCSIMPIRSRAAGMGFVQPLILKFLFSVYPPILFRQTSCALIKPITAASRAKSGPP